MIVVQESSVNFTYKKCNKMIHTVVHIPLFVQIKKTALFRL